VILAAPQLLVDIADPWAKLYSHSNVLATIVGFLHVAPIVVGGGLAIAIDRWTIRLRHDDPGARAHHLVEMSLAHRVVLAALALSFVSGLALFAADVETFFGSWIFWLKMGLIALLLVNGALMTRTERALRVGSASGDASRGANDDAEWRRLHAFALTSLALWLVITLAGVALMNLA
jgi:uncharacterized membrane protein